MAPELQARLRELGIAPDTLSRLAPRARTAALCTAMDKLPGIVGAVALHDAAMDQVARLLRDCDSGRAPLDAASRAELAGHLTALFMARTPSTARAAELRAGFLDSQTLQHLREHPPRAGDFPDRSRLIDLAQVPGTGAGAKDGATQSQTRAAIIVPIDGRLHRVKDIKYGNDRAAQEVMAGAVMALTGLDAPAARLAVNGQHVFAPSEATRHDYAQHAHDPAAFATVASPLVEGFKDLGALCLEAGVLEREIARHNGEDAAAHYRMAFGRFSTAEDDERKLEPGEAARDADQAGIDRRREDVRSSTTLSAQERADRLAGLEKEEDKLWKPWRDARMEKHRATMAMVEQLPRHLRHELHMAHAAALLTHNWDEYNWALANTGISIVGPDSTRWRVATVDHGNSLGAGFGGMDKSRSIERSARRGRLDDPTPPNRMREEDAARDRVGDGITAIGSVPRAVPVAAVLAPMIQAESHLAGSLPAGELDASREPALRPAVEMAFRLSLIPDEAFAEVARRHWPDGSPAFPRRPGDEALSAAQVAAQLVARRDEIVGAIPPASIARWREREPERARAAAQQVAAGVAGACGVLVDVGWTRFEGVA